MVIDGPDNRLIDLEAELGRETDCAQHAYRVFPHAYFRITYEDDALVVNILETAGVIPDTEIGNVVVEGITGEVAPPRILIDGAVDVVAQNTTLLVTMVVVVFTERTCPESRDLDDLATEADMRQAKPPADQPAIAEQPLNLVRRCIGRDIKILGMQLEHRVTHTASNEEGLVTRLVQSVQNLECALGKLGPRNVVLRPRDYSWFSGPVLRVLLQQFIRLKSNTGAV